MSLGCADGGLTFSVYQPPLNRHQQRLEEIRNMPIRRPSNDYLDYVYYNQLYYEREVARRRANDGNHIVRNNADSCCFAVIYKILFLHWN